VASDVLNQYLVKIGVDDEVSTELKKTFGEISKALKELSANARTAGQPISTAMDNIDKETKEATKSTSMFGDMLKSQLASSAIIGGLNKIRSGFETIGRAAVGMARTAVSGFASLVKTGVEYNNQMNGLQTNFSTLVGSTEKGAEIMNNIKKQAAATPFDVPGLAAAAQTMLGFGENTDNLSGDLDMLGNISMGDSNKLSGLALVFGQVQSAGKATMQDINQMINNGFNPLQIISQKTGESMSQLRDDVSKGKMSFDQVREAMQMATSEGGMFYKAMDNSSKTLSGQMSTLQDNFNALTGSITSKFSNALVSSAVPAVSDLVSSFQQLIDATSTTDKVVAQGNISKAIQQLSKSAKELVPLITDMAKPIIQVIPTIAQALVPALLNVVPDLLSAAGDIMSSIGEAIMEAAPSLLQAMSSLISKLVDGLSSHLDEIVDFGLQLVATLGNAIMTNVPKLAGIARDLLSRFFTFITSNTDSLIKGGMELIAGLINGIASAIPKLIPMAIQILSAIDQAIFSNIGIILEAGINLLMGLVQGLIDGLPIYLHEVPKILQTLLDALTNNLPAIIQAAITLLNNLITAIVQNLPLIVQVAVQLIMALVQGLIENLPALVEGAIQLVMALIDGIIQAIPMIVQAGIQLIEGLWTGSYQALPEVWGVIAQLLNDLSEAGQQLMSKMLELGKTLITSLWDGINSLAGWLGEKISGFIDGILSKFAGIGNKIAGFLGFGSDDDDASTQHAQGGVYTTQHTATVAEDDNPEAIVPLNSPSRAKSVLSTIGAYSADMRNALGSVQAGLSTPVEQMSSNNYNTQYKQYQMGTNISIYTTSDSPQAVASATDRAVQMRLRNLQGVLSM
jgi:tape measure domain-containing protein